MSKTNMLLSLEYLFKVNSNTFKIYARHSIHKQNQKGLCYELIE